MVGNPVAPMLFTVKTCWPCDVMPGSELIIGQRKPAFPPPDGNEGPLRVGGIGAVPDYWVPETPGAPAGPWPRGPSAPVVRYPRGAYGAGGSGCPTGAPVAAVARWPGITGRPGPTPSSDPSHGVWTRCPGRSARCVGFQESSRWGGPPVSPAGSPGGTELFSPPLQHMARPSSSTAMELAGRLIASARDSSGRASETMAMTGASSQAERMIIATRPPWWEAGGPFQQAKEMQG
jgi:hypothetical protein